MNFLPPLSTVSQAEKLWCGCIDNATPISYTENFVYFFMCAGKEKILRLTPQKKRTTEQISAELSWVNHLYSQKINVCQPVRSAKGTWLESIDCESGYTFNICVFDKLPGHGIDLNDEKFLQTSFFHGWGHLLGSIHAGSANFQPSQGKRLHRFEIAQSILDKMKKEGLLKTNVKLTNCFNKEWQWLETLPKTKHNYGLIHGDLAPNNMLYDNGRLAAFDFDSSSYGFLLFDLALVVRSSLNHIPRKEQVIRKNFSEKFIEQIIRGYHKANPIDDIGFENFERIIRAVELVEYITLQYIYKGAMGEIDSSVSDYFESGFKTVYRPVPLNFDRIKDDL